MADNETIADIIAWLRRPREGENAYLTLWRDEIAARIEVALRRERGDAAKLRDALKLCVDEMCNRCHESAAARGNPLPCLSGCEPVRKAKAALAAPLRNCDRFKTAAEAAHRRERRLLMSCARWILCHDIYGHTAKELLAECKEVLNDDGQFLFKED